MPWDPPPLPAHSPGTMGGRALQNLTVRCLVAGKAHSQGRAPPPTPAHFATTKGSIKSPSSSGPHGKPSNILSGKGAWQHTADPGSEPGSAASHSPSGLPGKQQSSSGPSARRGGSLFVEVGRHQQMCESTKLLAKRMPKHSRIPYCLAALWCKQEPRAEMLQLPA